VDICTGSGLKAYLHLSRCVPNLCWVAGPSMSLRPLRMPPLLNSLSISTLVGTQPSPQPFSLRTI
jgi:hypothetical protein